MLLSFLLFFFSFFLCFFFSFFSPTEEWLYGKGIDAGLWCRIEWLIILTEVILYSIKIDRRMVKDEEGYIFVGVRGKNDLRTENILFLI